jgi:rhodanese-related sulfurtransferase
MDLTQQQWADQLAHDDNAVILDVRTPEEWEEGVIPNAVLADFYTGPEFLNTLQSLDKDKNYYVYCKAGGRSAQTCSIMNQLGILHTFNLTGGMLQWHGEKVQPE